MPDVVQNVLIDFQVDYTQLTTAQEQLAKAGKIDTKGFEGIQTAITTTATDTKGLIAQFKTVATSATKMGKSVENAFGAGIQDALDEAGVSVKEFGGALVKANTPTKRLKTEMLELKEALARMKAEGKDTGKEFEALRARAGKLQDAISDANLEIKNAGSDTRGLDNVVGSIAALAGGFSAVQGAAALFGDNSEDLQKTLVRVNSAMALATGLQQFYNATLKEGSLAKLTDILATNGQVAVQKIYTAVTGQATAATTGFKLALAATGIGLFVIGVIALVHALEDTETGLDQVNHLIETQNTLIELNNKSIQDNIDIRAAQLKAEGAAESQLIRLRGEGLKRQIRNIEENNAALDKQRSGAQLLNETLQSVGATSDDATDSFNALNTAIEKNNDTLDDLNKQLRITKIEFDAALISENKDRIKAAEEAAKKLKELQEKAAREARELRIRQLSDELAAIERELLTVEKGSQDEINLRKQAVAKKAQIDLQAEKLTANKIELIKETSLNDQLELQKAFNVKATQQQLEQNVAINNAVLNDLNITNEKRLQLQIDNINTLAQLEINAAGANSTKILEITTKQIADIRALKLAAFKKEQQDIMDRDSFTNNLILTGLQKVSADTKLTAQNRIAAVRGVEIMLLGSLKKEVDANKKAFKDKLISNEDYLKKKQELADKETQIAINTQAAINEINQQDVQLQREKVQAIATFYIEIAAQVGDFLAQLGQIQTDLDNERIKARRAEIADLLEAGAITQKEAAARNKQLEALEKQARQRAAQREKNAALFQAALAIPKAFLEGLVKGGPPLAAIYAALAAIQAALIASKPIPKFFRGKRDRYEGPGEVADMGSELVERGGRMFLYTKPTQTYLGAMDKVYTAAQTREMLHNTDTRRLIVNNTTNGMQIDYVKMGAAIPKSAISINIDKDFIKESVAEGLMTTNYKARRYRWQ